MDDTKSVLNKMLEKFKKTNELFISLNKDIKKLDLDIDKNYVCVDYYSNPQAWGTEDHPQLLHTNQDIKVRKEKQIKREREIILGYVQCTRASLDYKKFEEMMETIVRSSDKTIKSFYFNKLNQLSCFEDWRDVQLGGDHYLDILPFKDLDYVAGYIIKLTSDFVPYIIYRGELE